MTHQPRTEETPLIRIHKRFQRKLQRPDRRGYPTDGQGPWIHSSLTPTPDPLAPHITGLVPNIAAVADPAVEITVNGIRFTATSVVEIDGVPQATTFTSATVVKVTYDALTVGMKVFRVRDGAKLSNAWGLSVTSTAVVTASNTKAEIVTWLMEAGVNITEDAVNRFTKDELLAIVDAFVNGDDVDPIINP